MAEFRLLGPVEVWDGTTMLGLGTAKQRAVLAVLLADAGHPVTVATLIDRVWDESPPAEARNVLYAHLSRIRRLVAEVSSTAAPVSLARRSGGYSMELDPDLVDRHRFRRLVERSRAPVLQDAHRAALLAEAIGLWRGDPLTDLAGEWASRLRETLRQQYLDAVVAWAGVELRLGRTAAVIDTLRGLIAEHPLVEPLTGALMQALHAAGRTAEALDCYGMTSRRMAAELGVDPGPTLRALHQSMLRAGVPAAEPTPLQGVPSQLPADVRGFTGRRGELAALDAILHTAVPMAQAEMIVAVLSGTAGVGKTALAVHWGRRVAEDFPDGQLYVNLRGYDRAGTAATPPEAVRVLLDSLGLPAERIPTGLDAQTALLRSLLTGRRMLLLLDNARDADQVRPLLPGAPGCFVLVTSRDQLTGLIVAHDAHAVTLDVLSGSDARDLLVRRLGQARVDAEPAAVAEIVEACARLPLALSVVAARAATHPGFPLEILAKELRAARGGLDAFTDSDALCDIRAVLSWSYQILSPAAARLFRLLALHPGPDTTVTAAASLAGLAPDVARPLMTELARAHLAAEHVPGRFASHDLLRAYATELVELHDLRPCRDAAVLRVLHHYLRAARTADALLDPHRDRTDPPPAPAGAGVAEPVSDAMAWFDAEHAVLVAAVAQAEAAGLHEYTGQLAWAMMTFLDRRGYWQDLATSQHYALDAAGRLGDDAAKAHVHRSLARAHARTGRYDEALAHLRPALALCVDLGDDTGQARTHLNLAWVLELKGEYAGALDHAHQALALNHAAGHRAAEANALNAVGWLHARLGDDQRAAARCQEALVLFEELGDGHGQATTWDSLGFAYHRLGRVGDAVAAYRRAAELLRALGDRYNEATALRHLGEVHADAGDPESARAAWGSAVALLEELRHPDAAELSTRLRVTLTSSAP